MDEDASASGARGCFAGRARCDRRSVQAAAPAPEPAVAETSAAVAELSVADAPPAEEPTAPEADAGFLEAASDSDDGEASAAPAASKPPKSSTSNAKAVKVDKRKKALGERKPTKHLNIVFIGTPRPPLASHHVLPYSPCRTC